jgi:eukaryotic-like serine/threonine-protein kinase
MQHTPVVKVGPYEIIQAIGEGGMYATRDTRLDRTVTIKFFKEQFSEWFEREARAIAVPATP